MPLGAAVRLLPTTLARDGDPKRGVPSPEVAARRHADRRRNLPDTVALLPTPRTADGDKGIGPTDRPGRVGVDLPTVAGLLPTPRSSDALKGSPGQKGSRGDVMLPAAVLRMLPTPTATNSHGNGANGRGELLLPAAVVERYGDYAAAVAVLVAVTGVEPPEPVEPNARGDLRAVAALRRVDDGGRAGRLGDRPARPGAGATDDR
jgi:hypothetical protein